MTRKFTNLYRIMYSIGPIYCRAVGSQTFNVYLDKVGVSSHFGRCHKWVKSRRVCVYPSERIHVVACGPIGTKFGTHMQILLQNINGSELNKSQPRCYPAGVWGF